MALVPNRKRPSQGRRSVHSRSSQLDSRHSTAGGTPRGLRGRAPDADTARVELLILQLRAMFGTVITAELALRQQGAERDIEIADCLRAGVSEPLGGAIEQLAVIGKRERRSSAN